MLNIKKNTLYFLAIFFTLFSSFSRAEVIHIDNDALQSLLDQGVPIVDIRRADEWNDTGIVGNSHLLTFFDEQGQYDAKQWLSKLDDITTSEEPVILICRSGARTRIVSQWLSEKQQYSRIYNVTNGILSWIEGGEKTVTPR